MEIAKRISTLKSRAKSQLHGLNTEEKTKNALLLPFFDVLGYDPFDVREVEPEFAVEAGEGETKTVDYAVKIDGAPAILFQCEEAKAGLETLENDSLFRHFSDRQKSARTVGIGNEPKALTAYPGLLNSAV